MVFTKIKRRIIINILLLILFFTIPVLLLINRERLGNNMDDQDLNYNESINPKDIISYLKANELSESDNNLLYVKYNEAKDTVYFYHIDNHSTIHEKVPLIASLPDLDADYSGFLTKTKLIHSIPSGHNSDVKWDTNAHSPEKTDSSLRWNFGNDPDFSFHDYKYENKKITELKTSSFFIWGTIIKLSHIKDKGLLYKYNSDSSHINELIEIDEASINRSILSELSVKIHGSIVIQKINDSSFSVSFDNMTEVYGTEDLNTVMLPDQLLLILDAYDKNTLSWNSTKHNSVNYIGYLDLTINGKEWLNFVNSYKNVSLKEFVMRAFLLEMESAQNDELVIDYILTEERSSVFTSYKKKTNGFSIILFSVCGIGIILITIKLILNKKEDEEEFETQENETDTILKELRSENDTLRNEIEELKQENEKYSQLELSASVEELNYLAKKFNELKEDKELKHLTDHIILLYRALKDSPTLDEYFNRISSSSFMNTSLKNEADTFNAFLESSGSTFMNLMHKVKLNHAFITKIKSDRHDSRLLYAFEQKSKDRTEIKSKEFIGLLIEIVIFLKSYVDLITDSRDKKAAGNFKILSEDISIDTLDENYRTVFDPSNESHHYEFVINIKNLLYELGIDRINYLIAGFDINDELKK